MFKEGALIAFKDGSGAGYAMGAESCFNHLNDFGY